MRLPHFIFATLVAALSCSVACDKKSGGDGAADEATGGTLNFSMKTTEAPAAMALLERQMVGTFKNSSIASGRPDTLKIYITKMVLEGSAGARTVFQDTEGKSITIGSKTVDMSNLFTNYACLDSAGNPVQGVTECPCGLDSNNQAVVKNADDSCPDSGNGANAVIQVSDGSYSKLSVEFQVRAKVKGCVTGDFTTVNNPPHQGIKTYCTKASGHTFQATPGLASATDFPTTGAEEMDYQISKANELYTDTSKAFSMDFPIEGGVTVSAGGTSPALTLLIDTNRMLRFFNVNEAKAPNPGMSDSRAYFFSTVFEESAFVFVGRPGDIRGFSWVIDACSSNPTGAACSSGNISTVAGWMTIIKDSNGKPLVVGIMPDDDNSFTVLKGSNKSSSGIDSTAFTANGSNYDVAFKLSSKSGALKNVNLDAALNSVQTVNATSGLPDQLTGWGGQTALTRKL